MTNRRNIVGYGLIILPFVALMLTLTAYAVGAFIFGSTIQNGVMSENMVVAEQLTNVILGFLGMLAIIGMFTAVPTGIYLLATTSNGTKTAYRHFDIAKVAKMTSIALSVMILSQSILILASISGLYVPDTSPSNIGFIVIGTLIIFVGWTLYLVWLYRASSNLHASHKQPKYSPAWSVVSHFIPVINFVKPVMVMRDIYSKSATEQTPHGEILIASWWGLYLTAGIINRAS